MGDFTKKRAPFLMMVPMIFAVFWGFMAYSILVLGLYAKFAQFILPLSYLLFILYFFGLFFWYRIEQSEYKKRIEILEMDSNYYLGRIENVEAGIADLQRKQRQGKE